MVLEAAQPVPYPRFINLAGSRYNNHPHSVMYIMLSSQQATQGDPPLQRIHYERMES